jgi:hypothetical protein
MKVQMKSMQDAIGNNKDYSKMDVTHHLLAGFKG